MIKSKKNYNIVIFDSDIEVLHFFQNILDEYNIITFYEIDLLCSYLSIKKCDLLFFTISDTKLIDSSYNHLNFIKTQLEFSKIILLFDTIDTNTILYIKKTELYNFLIKENDLFYIQEYITAYINYTIIISPIVIKEAFWKLNFPTSKSYKNRLKEPELSLSGRMLIHLLAKDLTIDEISILLDIAPSEIKKLHFEILRYFNTSYRYINSMIIQNKIQEAYFYLCN